MLAKNGTILACFTFVRNLMEFTSAVSSQVREGILPLNPNCDPELGQKNQTFDKNKSLLFTFA